jgi:TolB-like protein
MAIRSAVVVTLLCAACVHDAAKTELDRLADGTPSISHRALHPTMLVGELVAADPVIGDPRQLVVSGGLLWLADHAGDPYLHVIDLASGKLLVSRGRQGEGPGDFGEMPKLSVRPGDTTGVWAYDYTLRRLTHEDTAHAEQYTVLPASDGQVARIWSDAWIDRTRLVGVGDLDTNRLIYSDTAGHLIRLVKSSLLGPDSASIEARRNASSAYIFCVAPAAHRMAMLFMYGGRIDIHSDDGKAIARARTPFPSEGTWLRDKRGVLRADLNWYYYQDCATTDRYLYALFDGHRADGPHGGKTRAARYVHVFDWDGNLVSVLGLDHEMSTIAVAGDSVLFAAGQSTEGVYRYRLPSRSEKSIH